MTYGIKPIMRKAIAVEVASIRPDQRGR